MLELLAFGPRKHSLAALAALKRGAVDEATAACRAYFALRLTPSRITLEGADAQMVSVAALCAALRGDHREFNGLRDVLLNAASDAVSNAEAMQARSAVVWMSSALRGDLASTMRDIPEQSSVLTPHISGLVLTAVESASDIDDSLFDAIESYRQSQDLSASMTARWSFALGIAGLRSGNRSRAIHYLSSLVSCGTAFYEAVGSVSMGDIEAAAARLPSLSNDERGALVALAASLVVTTSSTLSMRCLEVFGPYANSAMRATLSASVAVALAKEGQLRQASALVQNETRGTPSPALAIAAVVIALLAGDVAGARAALRTAPASDRGVSGLRLLIASLAGVPEDLLREISAKPDLLPQHRQAVAATMLFALGRAGIAPAIDRSPSWLLERPTDPEVLYAWGLLRLRQEAAGDALKAFEEAIATRPELASIGDAPSVARVWLAREYIVAGNPAAAASLLSDVSDARLSAAAERLRALAYVSSSAQSAQVKLTAAKLPDFVNELARTVPPASREKAYLSVLRGQVARAQIGQSLRSGSAKQAISYLNELTSSWDGDAAFLHVAAVLSENMMSVADAESYLLQAVASEPTHEGLRVLLFEVQRALRGAEVGLATLESAEKTMRGTLLCQALTSAYRGVQRGLEAKRFGFSELRRGTDVSEELVKELADVLSFEVATKRPDSRTERITKHPLGSLLVAETLEQRSHLLLVRVGTVVQRDPSSKVTFEGAVQRLKRGLMSGDLAAARSAEIEIVELLGKVSA